MLSYILRRLAATLPVMLIVAVLVFLMLRLTPGDPAAIIAGDNANTEQVALIRNAARARPADPHAVLHLARQHPAAAISASRFFFKKTVAELIVEPARADARARRCARSSSRSWSRCRSACSPPTSRARWIDRIVMGFSVLGFSVPVFVIGYSLIYLFAIKLNWLPVQGYQRIARRLRRLPAAPDPALGHARR